MTNIGNKEIFAKNLRYYMDRSDKSQKELSDMLNVSTSTFNNWATAKRYPRIDKIEMLANYFGIQKSDLIEEKMTEEKEKDNDILADIIVRMRTDEEFSSLLQSIYNLDPASFKRYQAVLNALSE